MSTPSPIEAWPPRDADHLLVSGGQMASLEEELFTSGLPVEALMEKAALAVSRRLLALPVARAAAGVLVLLGPGHNGGDGLVVARELHLAGVRVRLWSPFERLKPLTEAHLRHARWLGLPMQQGPPDPGDPALWIDALFGVGQRRSPGEALEDLLEARQRQRPDGLVSIDVPTGLCSDSGVLLGRGGANAAVTYCIGLLKRGLVQDRALARVGRLERVDLALPRALLQGLSCTVPLGLRASDQAAAPWPSLDPAAGKYQRGRLLVVAGSRAYRGAAHLALAGATASGCGSLRAALPGELAASLWQVQPHVVLQPALGATASGGLALQDLRDDWLERLDAVLLGPGIGGDGGGAGGSSGADGERWRQLQAFEGLLVLDADGLNRQTADWLEGRAGPTWITPHAGEFARLFPDLSALPPLEAAAARRCGVAVLLKGARSVMAGPAGFCLQVLQACPEAARAGLGDVLAGYAAGRGAMAMAAGGGDEVGAPQLAAAALDHAVAGIRCREAGGPGSVTPQAVAAALCGFASKT